MWVKICGVRSLKAALHAQECGADAVGLNLHPPSARYIDPHEAARICEALDIETVLVVVDRSEPDLSELVKTIQPDSVQLHGNEPPGFGASLGVAVFKAFAARPGVAEHVLSHGGPRFLLDAWVPGRHGGTGCRADPQLARDIAGLGEMVLAGGLTPENVSELIKQIQPFGVDVASGVESSPGVQDLDRIAAFISAARSG
ncbi:MAG: phosphoribosylanthranilate isomerase [Myxococcota bacterium]|nr:phosphoribosylanthranilate isomerase [Myxococcota bacterium]